MIRGIERQKRWDAHKRIGEGFEDWILERIKAKYPLARKCTVEEREEFDIAVPEVGKYIECKFDKKSKDTGNLFIESQNSDGVSVCGIALSKTTHWCLGFWWENAWMYCFIETDALRTLCSFGDYKVTCEGTAGYVIAVADLVHYQDVRLYRIRKKKDGLLTGKGVFGSIGV
jgi:hypothetical protein